MQDITVGRYSAEEAGGVFGGYIEPKDLGWIFYLDTQGRPLVYYGEREAGGGVVDDSRVMLGPMPEGWS